MVEDRVERIVLVYDAVLAAASNEELPFLSGNNVDFVYCEIWSMELRTAPENMINEKYRVELVEIGT